MCGKRTSQLPSCGSHCSDCGHLTLTTVAAHLAPMRRRQRGLGEPGSENVKASTASSSSKLQAPRRSGDHRTWPYWFYRFLGDCLSFVHLKWTRRAGNCHCNFVIFMLFCLRHTCWSFLIFGSSQQWAFELRN